MLQSTSSQRVRHNLVTEQQHRDVYVRCASVSNIKPKVPRIFLGGFPGGPVVITLLFNAGSVGSIPGWGARIPHAVWPKINK